MMNEKELVEQLKAKKNKEAIKKMRSAYCDRLYKVAVYILGYHDPEAEEVVNEAFALAVQNIEQYDFRTNFKIWLNRICVSACYKRLRIRDRVVLGLDADIATALSLEIEGDQTLHGALTDKEKKLLKLAFKKVASPCRKIIKKRDFSGKSNSELARKSKVPIGTLLNRMGRCKQKLHEVLLTMTGGES